MRRGRRQKYLAGGLLPWTRAPYGYRVDPARPRDPAGVRASASRSGSRGRTVLKLPARRKELEGGNPTLDEPGRR